MLPKVEWKHTPVHREAQATLKASCKTAASAAVPPLHLLLLLHTAAAAAAAAAASSAAAAPAVAVSAPAVAPTDPPLAGSLEEDLQALDRLLLPMDHLQTTRPELDEAQWRGDARLL